MRRRSLTLAAIAAAVPMLAVPAPAAVVAFEQNGSADVTITMGLDQTGGTNVSVTMLSSAAASRSVFIESSANDTLGTISLVNRSSGRDLRVYVRGQSNEFSKRPTSIVEIVGGDGADNAGNIILEQCTVAGHVDVIQRINVIRHLDIGGSATQASSIALDRATGPNAVPPSFTDSTIGGDIVILDLPYAGSLIDNVRIFGSFGLGSNGILHVDHVGTFQVGGFSGYFRGIESPLDPSSLYVSSVHRFIVDDDSGPDGTFAYAEMWIGSLVPEGGTPGELFFEQGIAADAVVGFKTSFEPGDGVITLPTGGLKGRIVFGSLGGPGLWTGPVDVGSTPLAEGYENSAASLGGGVAGAVPFAVHAKDSVPEIGTQLPFTLDASLPEFSIRHYGWVRFPLGAADPKPVLLQRRARCIGAEWLDVTGEWGFDYSIPNGGQSTVLEMTASTPANFRNGFEYRFQREVAGLNGLYCYLETLGSPISELVQQYPQDGWFTVGSECAWDINGDSNTNVDDLNALLADWNTSGSNLAGDVNGSGAVDVEDLNLVLGHWNESGCAGCSQSLISGGGAALMAGSSFSQPLFNDGDLLVSELGYATVEDFCGDLAGMDAQEQDAMLAALGVAASE